MARELEHGPVDVNTATERLISLLPDDFVDRGMDALDDAESADNSEEETQDSEEEEEEESESEEASSEDADEADEGASDETSEDDDEEDGDAEDEAPQTFRVKVGGKESEVTADELVAGYQRQKDYTQKTMQIAEERRALEADLVATRAARDEYAARLADVKAFLAKTKPADPDWEKLRKENPAEFAAQWAEKKRREDAEQSIDEEEKRIRGEQQREQVEKLQAHLVSERERLYEAIPEWKKDAKLAKAEQKAMLEFAETKLGIKKEEVAEFSDHRAFLMLRMAMKYAEIASKGKEIVRTKTKKAPVLRPGQPRPRAQGARKEVDVMRKRLRKTGRVEDAARLFEKLLPDD